MSPKFRFRAFVRRVIANLPWLSQLDEDELGDNVAMNIKILSKKQKEKSLFTHQEKAILLRPAENRTEEERRMLYKVMKGLKCFRRYPDHVKKRLTAVTYFVFYGPGRVIVKQGNYAHATYFILDGTIGIFITFWDGLFNQFVTKEVGQMGPGDMFGEVSLLHGIARTATCTTKTECEFLYIKREDFERILKATIMKQWDECKRAMKMFPYFKQWNEVAIRECCILSKMMDFGPSEVISGFGKGKPLYTYFILSGECQLIEQLRIVVRRQGTKSYPQRLFTLTEPLEKGESVEVFFAQVCIFSKGMTFGLGEDLTNRAIVSLTAGQCLLCPRQWLLQNNYGNIWNLIKHYAKNAIPNRQQVYNAIIKDQLWEKRKQKMTGDIFNQSKFYLETSRHDAPYKSRLFNEVRVNRHGYTYLPFSSKSKLAMSQVRMN